MINNILIRLCSKSYYFYLIFKILKIILFPIVLAFYLSKFTIMSIIYTILMLIIGTKGVILNICGYFLELYEELTTRVYFGRFSKDYWKSLYEKPTNIKFCEDEG